MLGANRKKIIISGGGTGGHIFPAIAIAQELKAQLREVDILFVGAEGKIEMEKIPSAGFEIVGLPIAGIQRSLSLKNLIFPFKLINSLIKAQKIVKDFKPDLAIGVGGYASGPLLYMATQYQVPSLIQEQNSFAGLTNKWLKNRVTKICVAYEGMEKYFPASKLIVTGNPVRESILQNPVSKDEALAEFNFKNGIPTILIMGGSLGARSINEGLIHKIDDLISSQVQVIWQTGKLYFKEVQERLHGKNMTNIKVVEFLHKMHMAYAASDVVVSRAGALSVAELCIAGKPVIFIPSPNVAEDHQTKNTRALLNKNAAIAMPDAEVKEKLVPTALNLTKNKSKQQVLSNNILKMALPNATKNIVREAINLLNINLKSQ